MPDVAAPTSDRPHRGRRAPRVSGEERERAILETAERLLGERPLHEISVDDLAGGAGISRPAFYFYFSSKEDVLLALMDDVVEEARRGIDLERFSEDPLGTLQRGLAAIHEAFREHRAVTLAAAAARTRSPRVRELWGRVMETFVDETTLAVESERKRGRAPAGIPARDLAIALNWMNERVLQATFEADTPALSDEAVLQTLSEVWLRAIYAAPGPPQA
jgi:TetR/AcrR family transcriptional regulator, ethionamide resistance regulator